MNDKKLNQEELLARLIALNEKFEELHSKLSIGLKHLKEAGNEKIN
jgi:hypothetical protein